jgi:phage-related protein
MAGGDAFLQWQSYELEWPRDPDPPRRPVSDALSGSAEKIQVLKLMSRVEDLGLEDAKKLTVGGERRKRRIVKKEDFIYLLKCTPSCWRLYFYVRETERRFVYVHAVCKKQDAEDPSDLATAKQRYEVRASGRLQPIRFPS